MAANIIKLKDFRNLTGTKVVHCHGVFDVLHVGHLDYFKAARAHGQRLVVTITSDRYVNKGPGRPYFDQETRLRMVAELSCVDCVAISDYPSAVPAIDIIKPAFYAKGPDYMDLESDPTGKIYDEKEAVERHGGKLVFTDEVTYSSSTLINSYFAQWTDEQRDVIETIKQLGGMTAIKTALDQVKDTKVAVVGELIEDIYRFVRPEGLSSKSPSLSSRYLREESYQGGAWAIAKHLDSFCTTTLHGTGRVHKKIRYISEDTGQRLFEVTHLPEEGNFLGQLPDHGLLIEADFGHGLINGFSRSEAFKALNVQTNSSNYGFNVFTKHKSWNYLVLDTREIRLAFNDRHTDPIALAERIYQDYGTPVSLTMGPLGSVLIQNNTVYRCPAFADKVVDATGAGDAYFALTSLLVRAEIDPRITVFLGNVFAGLKTKIIGNSASVSKADLLKACTAILS